MKSLCHRGRLLFDELDRDRHDERCRVIAALDQVDLSQTLWSLRAIRTMAMFTGIDGIVEWNDSREENHHEAPPIVPGADLTIGSDDFEWESRAGQKHAFSRYDVIYINSVTKGAVGGLVTFQLIDKAKQREEGQEYGVTSAAPYYEIDKQDLEPHLRPISEAISAVIEGLALAKPVEYFLRHGEVMVDQEAHVQYTEKLPIVRRVRLGPWHVIATYDPRTIYTGEKREIVLDNFDGHTGLTVELPADDETRIFILELPNGHDL